MGLSPNLGHHYSDLTSLLPEITFLNASYKLTMQASSINQLTSRAEQLIDALAESIISTAEAAAERLDLASRVAQIQQRMAAFGAVLESVGAQKGVLIKRLEEKEMPKCQRRLVQRQIELLSAQETEILQRAGASAKLARTAVEQADRLIDEEGNQDPNDSEDRLYRRKGRRFVALEAGDEPAEETSDEA